MKPLNQILTRLATEPYSYYEDSGATDGFAIRIEHNGQMMIIASWGMHWDHVSVSYTDRCPTWEEMCWVKDIFWHEEETVVQYHPAKSEYVNCHPYCLHLWKPQTKYVPRPPRIMVGTKA